MERKAKLKQENACSNMIENMKVMPASGHWPTQFNCARAPMDLHVYRPAQM